MLFSFLSHFAAIMAKKETTYVKQPPPYDGLKPHYHEPGQHFLCINYIKCIFQQDSEANYSRNTQTDYD